jgi:hypothetical protein
MKSVCNYLRLLINLKWPKREKWMKEFTSLHFHKLSSRLVPTTDGLAVASLAVRCLQFGGRTVGSKVKVGKGKA